MIFTVEKQSEKRRQIFEKYEETRHENRNLHIEIRAKNEEIWRINQKITDLERIVETQKNKISENFTPDTTDAAQILNTAQKMLLISLLPSFSPVLSKNSRENAKKMVFLTRKNSEIFSSGEGVVERVARLKNGKNIIVISHAFGFRTTYEGNFRAEKKFGDFVKKGEKIASVTRESQLNFSVNFLHKTLRAKNFLNLNDENFAQIFDDKIRWSGLFSVVNTMARLQK